MDPSQQPNPECRIIIYPAVPGPCSARARMNFAGKNPGQRIRRGLCYCFHFTRSQPIRCPIIAPRRLHTRVVSVRATTPLVSVLAIALVPATSDIIRY